MNRHFQQDCLEILAAKAARGLIDRRTFAQLAAFVVGGAPVVLRARGASAAEGELVFVNWGGDDGAAYDMSYGAPFQAETGIAVRQDGSGPTEDAIAAQVESGKPTWDIVDADAYSAISLGKRGLLEPIDYTVVDKAKMRPGFGWDHAASSYFYSYVIAYDSAQYGGAAPAGMADFFDVEKFPGKRSLHKWGTGMWEAALLADGVAPDRLYPLDLDRAHAKLAAFKGNVSSYWGGGAESQQALLSGDAVMAIIWSSRAALMENGTGGRVKFVWDQGLISPGAMAVVKDNPGGTANAMRFLASAQQPDRQLMMFQMLIQGPANPAADALIPEPWKRLNCVDPANMQKQVALDMAWYSENYAQALEAYTATIAS